MEVLLIGAGVIGTVYGSHLAADGQLVSVLAHGAHTDAIAQGGLAATDLATGVQAVAPSRSWIRPAVCPATWC